MMRTCMISRSRPCASTATGICRSKEARAGRLPRGAAGFPLELSYYIRALETGTMIMPPRAIWSLPVLLVLLWAAACGNEVIMTNAVLVDMEVKDLPRDVVQSVALHWP